MRLGIFAASQKVEEAALLKALSNSPGVKLELLTKRSGKLGVDCDLHCIVGVKHAKVERVLKARGLPYLYWDKPYNREWKHYWRVSYCSHQPTRFLMLREFDHGRARKQGWLDFKPWRTLDDGVILFAGASSKYQIFHGLPSPDAYAAEVLREARRITRREFVYRPKPSYRDAKPIEGAGFSHARILAPDMERARVLVTHGSSTCLDALLAGVPAVILGDGVTRELSSTSLTELETPQLAGKAERIHMLSALAHFQWRIDEIARGELWPVIDWARKCM
jgi:hypothetical protein